MVDRPRRSPGCIALASLALLVGCGSAPPRPTAAPTGPAAVGLRLGIIGDQTWSDDLDAAYRILAAGVVELTRYHREVAPLDAVVHTGDLVDSTASAAEVAARFAEAAAILDRLPVPWYPAAGDHDVNPPVYRPASPDGSRRALYRHLVADRIPATDEALHYAVDLGNHLLIVLDSQQVAHADPRWGSTFLARIDDGQLEWLAAELTASRATGIVVALHQPHWLAWSGWRRVHELLRQHPVALVVAGHLHHPQDDGVLDGIRYLTVGATGGVTRTGSRDVGDVDHVTVVEIAGGYGRRDARAVLLPVDGRPLALPSRREMERAQALDVMLGALWEIGRRDRLHLEAGELVGLCGERAPPRLVLAGLGNPIDREVTLTITPPPGIAFRDATFTPGFCVGPEAGRPAVAGTTCRLAAPSPNVRFANPSGVELADEPALWEAEIALAPLLGVEALSERVTVRVSVAWVGDSGSEGQGGPTQGTLWLERPLHLEVGDCPEPRLAAPS